ncbi:PX domain-containing protein [Aphelenchoides fujianensis]|nr:PX domain-containing protein [Aphelenchoides fujianensis]
MFTDEDDRTESPAPVNGHNGTAVDDPLRSEAAVLPPTSNVEHKLSRQDSDQEEADPRTHRTEEVSLEADDDAIQVDISDALSERDKVKYTVHTRTTLPGFAKEEMSVVREHEEFIWLHTSFDDNEEYAGFIIPPAPPRPDFDASREKLQKLGEGEATMTKEEFSKMKQELEQEYLASFKKTVAMHETFLCRLAAHPIFRKDTNFRIFLEYDQELSVRGRNKKELVGSFFKRFTQSADEVLLSGQASDPPKTWTTSLKHEKHSIIEYNTHVKDATAKADRTCRYRRSVAESYAKIAMNLNKCGFLEVAQGDKDFGNFLAKMTDVLERLKKLEARVGTDQELKEADTLRYFTRESQAGKDLLYRRMRCLANYESANKNLERVRGKNKDAELEQAEVCKKFGDISTLAKSELQALKKRRVEAFKRNLNDLVDLQIKHSKNKLALLQSVIATLKEESDF